MADPAVALQPAARIRDRHADGGARRRRVRVDRRLSRQYGRAACERARRRAVRRPARARRADGARCARAQGAAVARGDRARGRGSQPEPHPAVPGDVRVSQRAAGRRGGAGGAGARRAARRRRGQVRLEPRDRLSSRRPRVHDRICDGIVRAQLDRRPARAVRGAARADRGDARCVRRVAFVPARRRTGAGHANLECDRVRAHRLAADPRALRRSRAGMPRRDRAAHGRRDDDVRGARRARRRARRPAARTNGRRARTHRDLPRALVRHGERDPRDAQGRLRLCADRPATAGRPRGVHAERQRGGAAADDRADSPRAARVVRHRHAVPRRARAAARRAAARGARRRSARGGLRALYVRLDRQAEGRRRHARERDEPARRDGGELPGGRARSLSAEDELRVRRVGAGAVRLVRRRRLARDPRAAGRGLARSDRRGIASARRHAPEFHAVAAAPVRDGGGGRCALRARAPAAARVRRRRGVDERARERCVACIASRHDLQHVRPDRDDRVRHRLRAHRADPERQGADRARARQHARLRARRTDAADADRDAGRLVYRRRRRRARLPESRRADRRAVPAGPVHAGRAHLHDRRPRALDARRDARIPRPHRSADQDSRLSRRARRDRERAERAPARRRGGRDPQARAGRRRAARRVRRARRGRRGGAVAGRARAPARCPRRRARAASAGLHGAGRLRVRACAAEGHHRQARSQGARSAPRRAAGARRRARRGGAAQRHAARAVRDLAGRAARAGARGDRQLLRRRRRFDPVDPGGGARARAGHRVFGA
ncbi:Uncharacterised protein [Burkholderia pseudomallei]|nr:Uncharacterised protein [Burkholderia pseudomallei]